MDLESVRLVLTKSTLAKRAGGLRDSYKKVKRFEESTHDAKSSYKQTGMTLLYSAKSHNKNPEHNSFPVVSDRPDRFIPYVEMLLNDSGKPLQFRRRFPTKHPEHACKRLPVESKNMSSQLINKIKNKELHNIFISPT